ncbi:PAS domain-containing protein [Thiomicrospira sp. R3]|uniref:PAS domain-containing protein n=1 Tax=Thiomicrospira sp. R3 TaxID=3035472 RepID=UPI00259B0876|nr:PAS domain-containing protein [Thiomicrospira sp. R3]WFE67815.1 PAS domain-containing protein [Thiomicrospira sp. R3]
MFFPKLSQISTHRVITLADHHSIQDAVNLMDQKSLRDVVITGERGLRMITARELIALRLQEIDFSTTLADVTLQAINSISQDASVIDGLAALKVGRFDYLCLLDSARNLTGIVSYSDMAANLDPHYLSEFKRIDDLIHLSGFVSVEQHEPLKSVLILLREQQQTAALVKATDDQHIGIVTQKDITHAIAQNRSVESPVSEIMVSPLVTIDGQMSLQQALSFSREKKLKRLVVTNNSKVVGLLHQKDLVALVYEKWRNLLDEQQRHLQAERELFKNGPVMLFSWQASGNWPVKFVSDNVKDILGYTAEEMMQPSFEFGQILHPDDLEPTKQELVQALANKTEFLKQTYRLIDKGGRVRWVYDYTRPSYDANGEVLTVYGYIIDQTEQIQAKLQAEQAQQQLELALEASETGLWVWDVQTNHINWSDQAFAQLGYPPQAFEVTLQRFQSGLHPDDAQSVLSQIEKQMAEQKVFNVEFRFQNAQGGWTWLQGRGRVTKSNAQGTPIEMMGVHIDISATKKIQLELQEQTELYLNLVESHPFFINRFLPDTTTLYANKTMAQFFGASQEQMHGSRWIDALPIADQPPALEALSRCSFEHPISVNVNQVCDAQGELRSVKWTTHAFYDESRQLRYFQSVGQDITEQLALEDKLKHAKQQAEAANQAKSEFLANMSHEIRTPMNGIIGLSELAMKQDDVEILHEQLDKIYHSGRLLLGIINDILDFSKIEAGKLEIDPQPFFIDKLFDGLASLFAIQLQSKPVKLHFDMPAMPARALIADSLRLRQVLINLLGNAIKFTDQGEVRVSVSECQHPKPSLTTDQGFLPNETCLCFEVKDTGIGMSSSQKQKLFQAFEQADTSITRKHGGTGLGLVISQRLIDLMGGGAIDVESEVGQGSCFRFYLPFQVATEEQTLALKLQTFDHQDLVRLKGHVLLVEDNTINQEVARNQLINLGLRVTLAENGQQALDSCRDQYFDLVLMDIQMPLMDGYQATCAIREFDQDTPIIALTAAAMIEDKKKALTLGMNDHLSKPIDRVELTNLLGRYLKVEVMPQPQAITPMQPELSAFKSKSSDLIDYQKGLSQLNGNQLLYDKLLVKFGEQLEQDYVSLPAKLSALVAGTAMAAEDWAQLQQLNHALKGLAGNLAVDALFKLSQQLDLLLKQQQRPSDELILQFNEVYLATQRQLLAGQVTQTQAEVMAGSSATRPASLPNLAPATSLVARLNALLLRVENSEYIDDDELHQLGVQDALKYNQAWLSALHSLDNFEFEPAAEQLSHLVDELSQAPKD